LKPDTTGYLLPPEFYALGIHDNVEPWTPVDTLSLLKIMNFHLSGSWNMDLMREIFSKVEVEEIRDMVDELIPHTAEFAHNLQSVLDEDDMKQDDLYHD